MSTEEGIRIGLRAAATQLEDTADDFDEMANKKEEFANANKLGYASVKQEIAVLRDKAKLLRGQAGHVRELKVTRGR
jgi:hypothetical protein